MKTSVLFFLALFSSSVFAQMNCVDVQVHRTAEDKKGEFVPTGAVVQVSPHGTGYQAVITAHGKTQIEIDVLVGIEAAGPEYQELLASTLPGVKWSDVAAFRVANIGVKANRQNGGGVMLYEVLDASGVVVGKFITFGWMYGRCSA